MSSRSLKVKKEARKIKIEIEIKDKKAEQTNKLTHEEEVELEYAVLSPFDNTWRSFPGRKKYFQVDKDGKKYDLLLEGEVKKGWFKDTPLGMTIKPVGDFEIISQKIIFPQWRARGFIAIGIMLLLLVGGSCSFYFLKKV